MAKIPDINDLRFKDTSFASLMNKRIYNILLIATKYDSFILEDNGRIDEQIFNEYTSLNLRYPPRFTQVKTESEALEELQANRFELVIHMPNMDEKDNFSIAKTIKAMYPDIYYVVLTPFSKEVSKRLANEDLSAVDYVFSWLGNSELLLAIIKLIEDKMNVESDTQSVGVQAILLIEDSVRFYSSALPTLFKIILEESKAFSKEALNEHEQMLRMRGRPKILLARNYEEAIEIYDKYQKNILGIITDMSYPRDGIKDPVAGYMFTKKVKSRDPFIPIVLSSSEVVNKKYANEVNSSFIDKNSKTFPVDLKKQVINNFGFGTFIIQNPETKEEVFRIKNLKDLQKKVHEIPNDALLYHMQQHHFSRFFYSRAIFPIAELLKEIDASDFRSTDEAREVIYNSIIKYRRLKNSGVVAIFDKERYDEYSNFARIGDGSIGGKGRSIAFMDHLVKEHSELNEHINLLVKIPRTLVLCTDIFDEFMETNDLFPIALSDVDDEEILKHFLEARLPNRLLEDFIAFIESIKSPIAIRSSSLLEDSHYQPFAGVYSTYMIPHLKDKYKTLHSLTDAIKAVYASVFYKESKMYMLATQNVIDQEKMAIILQEVVGTTYNERFYPTISGVARSLNYYPVGNEKPEEGIVNIVFGLGKYIVEGGENLRFSPHHPRNIMQLSSVEFALRDTQRYFYALDVSETERKITTNDGYNILKLKIKDAEDDNSLRLVASTYDATEQTIYDGYYEEVRGRKIISFSQILQNDLFPLAGILKEVLRIGEEEMGRAVEIEFAVNLDDVENGYFYLLQIRPVVQNKEMLDEDLSVIDPEKGILYSEMAMGHGITNDVYDIVYVKTMDYNAAHNINIVDEIEKLNTQFFNEDKNYYLVGPGRWGSSDHWLGIPIKWSQISNAKILVELELDNYRIEPSQGTHFFHNLTSFGVGYFSINTTTKEGNLFDENYLDSLPALYESELLRHVRFDRPIVSKIDGMSGIGVVLKPDTD